MQEVLNRYFLDLSNYDEFEMRKFAKLLLRGEFRK